MVRSSQKSPSGSSSPARQRRTDTGVWPCSLDNCTKVFAREADLKRHQRTTKSHLVPGSGVGSPCPLCEATFTRTDAMRRHLKSRHNGKTPETLHLPDVQVVPSSSSSRKNRRPRSPSEGSDGSGSDGEIQSPSHGHRRSMSSSRDPSAAPQYFDPAQHAPPPPPHNTNMSPAILYQAAMSYEIRHALAPSSPTSPMSAHSPSSPTMPQSGPSRRDPYPPPPPQHGPYTQFPTQDYAYQQQHQSSYSSLSPQHSPFPHGGPDGPMYPGAGVYSQARSPTSYVPNPWAGGQGPGPGGGKLEDVTVSLDRRARRDVDHSSRAPFGQQETLPSGLAALAMHAARIRPMSPLPNNKQPVKTTKSELETALGPPYSR